MIVKREKRHEARDTRERIITFVDGKPRSERESFLSTGFAFQAIRDRSRLIQRTSLASVRSFARPSRQPRCSPIVREIRRTRQLETTFLTCNVISYVPLAFQRPETPEQTTMKPPRRRVRAAPSPRRQPFSLETRLSAGEEVEITLKARLCGRHCIDLARRGSARHAKPKIKPAAAFRASSRIEFRRLAGLVFSRVGERAHASPTN